MNINSINKIIIFVFGCIIGSFVSEKYSLLAQHNIHIMPEDNIVVMFTPGQRCAQAIANLINNAKEEALVQAYVFTSPSIGQALIQAHKRGVRVVVIFDKSQFGTIWHRNFENAGIEVVFDTTVRIAHNKVIIVDKKCVELGSYNFTIAAETKNAENVAIINNAEVAKKYLENWNKRYQISVRHQNNKIKHI